MLTSSGRARGSRGDPCSRSASRFRSCTRASCPGYARRQVGRTTLELCHDPAPPSRGRRTREACRSGAPPNSSARRSPAPGGGWRRARSGRGRASRSGGPPCTCGRSSPAVGSTRARGPASAGTPSRPGGSRSASSLPPGPWTWVPVLDLTEVPAGAQQRLPPRRVAARGRRLRVDVQVVEPVVDLREAHGVATEALRRERVARDVEVRRRVEGERRRRAGESEQCCDDCDSLHGGGDYPALIY